MSDRDETMEELVAAIEEHSGMDRDEIASCVGPGYGADAGWDGFLYTADAARFYREHDRLIDGLLADQADDFGVTVAEHVASFGRSDMAGTRDGRDNLIAWWALEHAAHYLNDLADA